MPSFLEILSKKSVFKDRNALSPHYLPPTLPFREKEIKTIMRIVSPALKGDRPHNLVIYGKTGTGKTASVKHVMKEFEKHSGDRAFMCYVNCRMYNTKYRVIQKIVKTYVEGMDKSGFGITTLYEKLLGWIESKGAYLIVVLDEIDMVKDLDGLIYTLTRANDELKRGGISLIGISNKLSFKEMLDPRSKSSLYETECIFPPYTAVELQEILRQRVELSFKEGVVEDSAINLAAAITAQETGDARYALKLMLKAGEIADEKGLNKITDKEVELARVGVDDDLAAETIVTLPDHQQFVLLAIANLTIYGSRYSKLNDVETGFLFSGEVYEEYRKVCKEYHKKPRTARWYQEYLNDLEMLGLITTVESGKGIRGHTRLIRIGYSAESVKSIIERNFQMRGSFSAEGVP